MHEVTSALAFDKRWNESRSVDLPAILLLFSFLRVIEYICTANIFQCLRKLLRNLLSRSNRSS